MTGDAQHLQQVVHQPWGPGRSPLTAVVWPDPDCDQDAYAVRDSSITVVDGVTPVLSPSPIDVSAYAHTVAATLADLLEQHQPLPDTLAAAIDKVATQIQVDHVAASATVAAARVDTDGNLQLLRLGNTVAAAESADGSWTVLARPPRGPTSLLRQIAARRAAGVSAERAWKEAGPMLARARQDEPDRATHVFADDPAAVSSAMYAQVGRPTRLLLCTDGLADDAVEFGLVNTVYELPAWVFAVGPAEAAAQVRRAQMNDPHGQQVLRPGTVSDLAVVTVEQLSSSQ